jgi:hypothetical protein
MTMPPGLLVNQGEAGPPVDGADQKEAMSDQRPPTARPIAGVGLGIFGLLAAWGIGSLLKRAPTIPLGAATPIPLCGAPRPDQIDLLHFYAAESTQLAMFLLLCVTAAIALGTAAAAVHARLQPSNDDTPGAKAALRVVYVGGALFTAGYVIFVLRWDSAGYLTRLLAMLGSASPCELIRSRVIAARWVGEGTGFLVGTAMVGLAVISKPTDAKVADRILWLQHLLYASSLLFVGGLLVTGANFTWVLANWKGSGDEKVAKALQEVVTSATAQAGVGYSALIVVFFLPIRLYLAAKVQELVPSKSKRFGRAARANLLKDNGVEVSWLEDAKQILALLAPVLAAPIFDAIAKPK